MMTFPHFDPAAEQARLEFLARIERRERVRFFLRAILGITAAACVLLALAMGALITCMERIGPPSAIGVLAATAYIGCRLTGLIWDAGVQPYENALRQYGSALRRYMELAERHGERGF